MFLGPQSAGFYGVIFSGHCRKNQLPRQWGPWGMPFKKFIKRDFPHIVEIVVPSRRNRRKWDAMIKRKRTAKKNKPERAPDEDFLPTTFNEFEKPSPHYKFETTPGGQRMLSAPNNSERSLLSFQPYAQRALAIAQQHRLRIRPHSVQGSRFRILYDLIVIFP